MIDADQIRGARGMLGWSQDDLAARSGISTPTIKRIEKLGVGKSSVDTVQAIENCFRQAGVSFLDADENGPGLRVKTHSEPVATRPA